MYLRPEIWHAVFADEKTTLSPLRLIMAIMDKLGKLYVCQMWKSEGPWVDCSAGFTPSNCSCCSAALENGACSGVPGCLMSPEDHVPAESFHTRTSSLLLLGPASWLHAVNQCTTRRRQTVSTAELLSSPVMAMLLESRVWSSPTERTSYGSRTMSTPCPAPVVDQTARVSPASTYPLSSPS